MNNKEKGQTYSLRKHCTVIKNTPIERYVQLSMIILKNKIKKWMYIFAQKQTDISEKLLRNGPLCRVIFMPQGNKNEQLESSRNSDEHKEPK